MTSTIARHVVVGAQHGAQHPIELDVVLKSVDSDAAARADETGRRADVGGGERCDAQQSEAGGAVGGGAVKAEGTLDEKLCKQDVNILLHT